jgi:hypothetical protein
MIKQNTNSQNYFLQNGQKYPQKPEVRPDYGRMSWCPCLRIVIVDMWININLLIPMYLHNTYGRMNKDYTVYTLCLHNIITHYYENICFVFIFFFFKGMPF